MKHQQYNLSFKWNIKCIKTFPCKGQSRCLK